MKSLKQSKKNKVYILGTKINCSNYEKTIKKIDLQIQKKQSHFVCVAAVHLIMEAKKDSSLQKSINKSLTTTSDGMPLVWLCQSENKETKRVYGPDLMLKLCELAEVKKYKIFLLGGNKGQGKKLSKELQKQFPLLKIAGYQDTPVRPIKKGNNQEIIKKIKRSKADLIFVGLGCPLQEKWMVKNYEKLNQGVCVGVGAAFDFISGQIKQAPPWIRDNGLEWFFRLIQEPQRLWKRYLMLNTLFLLSILKEKITKNE